MGRAGAVGVWMDVAPKDGQKNMNRLDKGVYIYIGPKPYPPPDVIFIIFSYFAFILPF